MTIKGHFDGATIVLDEPATLKVGQVVRVIVDVPADATLDELAARTDEVLEPARQAFTASGMSDDDLAEFLEVEKHALRGVPYNHHE